MRPIGIGGLLVVLGMAAVSYQGITYTSRVTVVDIGPLHATVDRQKTLPLPPIVGAAAVAAGMPNRIADGANGNSSFDFDTPAGAGSHGNTANRNFSDDDRAQSVGPRRRIGRTPRLTRSSSSCTGSRS